MSNTIGNTHSARDDYRERIANKKHIASIIIVIGLIIDVIVFFARFIVGRIVTQNCTSTTFACGAEVLNVFPFFAIGFVMIVVGSIKYYQYKQILKSKYYVSKLGSVSGGKKVIAAILLGICWIAIVALSIVVSFYLFLI